MVKGFAGSVEVELASITHSRNRSGRIVFMTQKFTHIALVWLVLLAISGTSHSEPPTISTPDSDASKTEELSKTEEPPNTEQPSTPQSGVLMTGHWTPCVFGGDGPIEIKDDGKSVLIKTSIGDPITGVTWEGDVPRENYEISYEAMREDGFDFFGALTFPIGDGHATLVPAGWGGGVFGLSSINDQDASENETTQYIPLENDQWYKFRVRVSKKHVVVCIDDKEMIHIDREGKKFSLRAEMDLCKPIGFAAFQCVANVRAVTLRQLAETEPNPAEADTEAVDNPSTKNPLGR
jgi:hypothetical protein